MIHPRESETAWLIRRAQAADAPGICAAHLASIRGVCARDYSAEQVEAWCANKAPELYPPMIARNPWWVALLAGEVVAFTDLDPGITPGRLPDGTGEIMSLYAAPRALGLGIGAALVNTAIDEARRRGLRRLVVRGTITARPFYERMGFARTGCSEHCTSTGVSLPCIELERAI